jgi:hypothetical protein
MMTNLAVAFCNSLPQALKIHSILFVLNLGFMKFNRVKGTLKPSKTLVFKSHLHYWVEVITNFPYS